MQGTMMMARTGCDLSTSITMPFPKLGAVAFRESIYVLNLHQYHLQRGVRFDRFSAASPVSTSFAYNNPRDVVARIIGTKG